MTEKNIKLVCQDEMGFTCENCMYNKDSGSCKDVLRYIKRELDVVDDIDDVNLIVCVEK